MLLSHVIFQFKYFYTLLQFLFRIEIFFSHEQVFIQIHIFLSSWTYFYSNTIASMLINKFLLEFRYFCSNSNIFVFIDKVLFEFKFCYTPFYLIFFNIVITIIQIFLCSSTNFYPNWNILLILLNSRGHGEQLSTFAALMSNRTTL